MVSFTKNVLISLAASCLAQAQVLPFTKRAEGGLKLDFSVRTELTNVTTIELEVGRSDAASQPILTSLHNYQSYYGVDIELGSNNQKIQVDIDTGSSDLWVPSANVACTNGNDCSSHGTYNPSTSTTSKDVNRSFQIFYGDQSTTSGKFYEDTITVAGVPVPNLQFAVADTTSVRSGGIFGIGYQSLESQPNSYTNFPALLKQEGLISGNFYSLYLDSLTASTGSLLFGGIDDTKYSGSLVDLPFVSDQYFDVTLDSVKLNGQTIDASGAPVLLDSGTTITYLPNDLVDSIAAQLGEVEFVQSAGAYVTTCAKPDGGLDFNFNGVTINSPWDNFIVPILDNNGNPIEGYCELNIRYQIQGSNILGDNFLRNAYIVFDLDNQKARIAQAKY